MPKHGSDSDNSYRSRSRRKKAKKKASKRSVSSSSSDSVYSDKSKPRQFRSKSRSLSPAKHKARKRSRSPNHRNSSKTSKKHKSRQKRRSRSRSKGKRTRSNSREQRTRRSRSGSWSRRGRRSRSSSREDRRLRRSKSRSRSLSRNRRSRRSRSNSKEGYRLRRSNSRSRSGSRGRHLHRSLSNSETRNTRHLRSESDSPRRSKTGQDLQSKKMSEEETMREKLQAAIKAAADADAVLRQKGLLSGTSQNISTELTVDQQMKRAQAIEAINAGSFVQQEFTSTREWGKKVKPNIDINTLTEISPPTKNDNHPQTNEDDWKRNPEKLVHPNLFEDPKIRMDKWIKKLAQFRSKKYHNGDAHV